MSPVPTAFVSVVIVNFRGADDTIECVTRLREVDWPEQLLDIVVVENGSGDDSLSQLTTALGALPNVRIVESQENLGFTGGSNLGARESRGEILAFLNNDAKPDADWISAAIEQFNVSPAVAAVGSKVLDWEGDAIDFVDSGMTWYGMGFKEHLEEPDDGSHDEAHDLLFGTGSALFVKRDVFREVGGFDERLFMFYDDVDLGWRLNLLGWRVRFAPGSVVRHRHHGSMRSFGTYRETFLLERNALVVLYKNLSDENLGDFLAGAMAMTARRATTAGKLDSEQHDIRRFEGAPDETDDSMRFSKAAASGLFALDSFVSLLPSLTESRAEIQEKRVKTDREMFHRFGDAFRRLDLDPLVVKAQRSVEKAFSLADAFTRRNVLVITGDAIGAKMAGPAMRAWRISEALAQQNNVRLVTWNSATRSTDEFEVFQVRRDNEREMGVHESWADVIVFQGHAMDHFDVIRRSEKIMVVDLYDPIHLEQLEQGREWGTPRWSHQVASATDVLNQQLKRGDYFLCASERQRLFWLGQLAAIGRVNPENYEADENLGRLIGVVPFGMDSADAVSTRPAIRGVVPGIGPDDKVVIWGGGLYNWFDTLTLVRATGILAARRPNVRLFFLGVKHPNPDVPEMAIVGKTRELAQRLGLDNVNVFFNEQWVALDDRQNYLLEADAGVSTHFDHIETTLSFRTRILDYMWARLPIVTTRGDSFGDLVAAEGMGVAVPERDAEALAAALEVALYDDVAAAAMREAVERVRARFTWERALEPLVRFCHDPQPAPDRALGARRRVGKRKPRRDSVPSLTGNDRLVEFHDIGTSEPGVQRDLALARYYLEEGGVRMLVSKAAERAGIKPRGSRSGADGSASG